MLEEVSPLDDHLSACSNLQEVFETLNNLIWPKEGIEYLVRAKALVRKVKEIDDFSDRNSIIMLRGLFGQYVARTSGFVNAMLTAEYGKFCEFLDENTPKADTVSQVQGGVMAEIQPTLNRESVLDMQDQRVNRVAASRAYKAQK